MSLKDLAEAVRSHGRNGDTVLMHVSPEELRSMQSLAYAHGGSITINPHTGLPEASFLKRIMPMVLGAGLAATGVGAPLAASMVGGGYGLATGSLKQGLMAGLGAYGGAGLGSGLAGMGASSAEGAASAGQGLTQAEAANATNGALTVAAPSAGAEAGSQYALSSAPAGEGLVAPAAGAPAAASSTGQGLVAPQGATLGAPAQPTGIAGLESAGRGIGQLTDKGGLAKLEATMADQPGVMSPKTHLMMAAAPMMVTDPQAPAQSKIDPGTIRPYTMSRKYNDPGSDLGGSSSERRWYDDSYTAGTPYKAGYADGGTTAYADGGSPNNSFTDTGLYDGYAAGGLAAGGFVVPADVVSALGNGSSSAGLEVLQARLGAKPIKGPGDGMSDSIPTTIGGTQPARVARDEAYLTPEQVKKAGGSKRLYAMMDAIRRNAHGKTSQQRPVDPSSVVG